VAELHGQREVVMIDGADRCWYCGYAPGASTCPECGMPNSEGMSALRQRRLRRQSLHDRLMIGAGMLAFSMVWIGYGHGAAPIVLLAAAPFMPAHRGALGGIGLLMLIALITACIAWLAACLSTDRVRRASTASACSVLSAACAVSTLTAGEAIEWSMASQIPLALVTAASAWRLCVTPR
jgi:hypothetical protein